MRPALLILSFLPFVFFATKDHFFHLRGRSVSRTEHVLHAAIGLALVIVFSHAVMAHHAVVLGGLVIFVIAGAADEYIFHRDIPGEESDLHAKEHLALLAFVVISLATNWLEQNRWSWAEIHARLSAASGGRL